MKSVILILIFCLTSYSLYAQIDAMTMDELNAALDAKYAAEPLMKNAVLLTPSFPAGLGLGLAYERFITKSNNLAAKLDLIGIYTWDFEGIFLGPQLVYLSGKRKGHFEAGVGLTFELPTNNYSDLYVLPSAHLGFRYQKPGGNFIFRTGLGFPAGIYLGFGVAF